MTLSNMPAPNTASDSTDLNSFSKLALLKLDLGRLEEELEGQESEKTTKEQDGSDLRKETAEEGRKKGNGDDTRAAQKVHAYKALRRSISRPEHEASELQRPHSSHGCQSSDASPAHPQMPHPSAAIHHRPRARSPYSWTCYRSRSAHTASTSPQKATTASTSTAATAIGAPQATSPESTETATTTIPSAARADAFSLAGARSSPAVISHNPLIPRPAAVSQPPNFRPTSPFRAPVRVRSPFRYSQFPEDQQLQQQFGGEFASISEDSELEFTPRSFPVNANANTSTSTNINTRSYSNLHPHRSSSSPCSSSSSSFLSTPISLTSTSATRSRRPNSPMRHVSAPTSAHSSPLLAPAPNPIPSRNINININNTNNNNNYPNQYNETYPLHLSSTYTASTPTLTALSSSSVPSTPTSTRSRSPSISSLETIPDSPRAEKEAEAALAAAEAAAIAAAATTATTAPDVGAPVDEGSETTFTEAIPRVSSASGIAVRDKRKRWSVCGAESRRDLDLETIWED